MYAPERQQLILDQARTHGRVEVAAVAESLGVATETVRRDLTTLEGLGRLRRVHGGAVLVQRDELEPSLAHRQQRLTDEKRRIAARALEELPQEGTVLLDAGTTTQALAELVPADARLTVVTNSVAAAAALVQHPDVSLYLLGGRVRGTTGAAVGTWTTSALEDLSVDVAFMGTNGLSVRRGITTPDQAEAMAKRAMVLAARRPVVLTDSSKVGDDHLHRVAELQELSMIITDAGLDDETAAEIESAGPDVVRA